MPVYTGAGAYSAFGEQTLTWGQPIEVTAGSTYTVFARLRAVMTMRDPVFNIGLEFSNGSTVWALSAQTISSNDWLERQGNVVVPAGATSAILKIVQTEPTASFEVDEFKAGDVTLALQMAAQVTAAAGHASTASTKATEAGQSANAAASSATTANTKAGEAATSASQASQSKTDAAGSASAASTSATSSATARDQAQTAAGNAAGSATAANTSAGNAAASATTAGQQAAIAATRAGEAATSAGTASTKATEAAVSATDALGSRNAAATSATTSAAALNEAQRALASSTAIITGRASSATLPYGGGWTGSVDTYPVFDASGYGSDADGSYFARSASAAAAHTILRAMAPAIDGNVYRITARVKATAANVATLVLSLINSDGSSVAATSINASAATPAGTMVTITATIGRVAGGLVTNTFATQAQWAAAVGVRFGVRSNNAVAGSSLRVYDIQVDDLTNADQAARQAGLASGSANAASSSATAASASATTAGEQATAANSAKNAAETARGQAQTAATNAATSESNAAGSANAASTSAGVSATALTDTQRALAAVTNVINGRASTATLPYGQYVTGTVETFVPFPIGSNYGSDADGTYLHRLATTSGWPTVLRNMVPSTDGNVYRVTIRFKTPQAMSFSIGVAWVSSTGAQIAWGGYKTQVFAAGGGMQSITMIFGRTAGGLVDTTGGSQAHWDSAYGLRFALNNATGGAGQFYQVYDIQVDDLTQADLAARQAGLASGSAAAASNSATNAAASATTAGQQATAASTSANNASTSAGTATTKATEAATSATNALGSQNAAATSANVAAQSASNALLTVNTSPVLPSDFSNGLLSWTSSRIGTPESTLPTTKMVAVSGDTDFGYAVEFSPTVVGDNVMSKGVVPGGKAYRVTTKFRVVSVASGTTANLNIIASELNAGMSSSTYGGGASGLFAAGSTVHTLTSVFAGAAGEGVTNVLTGLNTSPWFRFGLRLNGTPGAVIRIGQILIEDVTSQLAAQSSATASASSASTAGTHATNAGTSATAANTAKTNAETAAGQASTSATNASNSATTAQGHANTASTAATTSATAKDVALRTAADLMPSTFDADGTFWTHGISGVPATRMTTSLPASVTFGTDAAEGRYAQLSSPQAANVHFAPQTYISGVANRRYRLTVRAIHIGAFAGTSQNALRMNMRRITSAYNGGTDFATGIAAFTAANTWQTFTLEGVFSGSDPWFLPFAYVGSADFGGSTGRSIRISMIKCEDITESAAAAASATAASTQATNAAASATAAGTSATTATTQASTATTQAGLALTRANNAATSETNAAGSAQKAEVSVGLAALAMSSGILRNPVFGDWTGTNPAHTSIAGTGTTSKTTGKYGNGLRMTCAGAVTGPYITVSSSGHTGGSSPDKVLITAEVEVLSGTATGLMVDAEWLDGSTVYRAGTTFGPKLKKSGIEVFQAVIERPANAPGTVSSVRYRLLTSWNSYGGVQAPVDLIVHRFDVQEIKADSYIDQQLSTKASLDGIMSSTYLMRLKSGGASAGFEMVAASGPTGPASAIRMSADEILMDGTLKAPKIGAGEVTASKLAIGDTSNLFPDPMMVDDAIYQSSVAYTFGGNTEVGSGSSTRFLQIGSGVQGTVLSAPIPVEFGASYYVSSVMEVNGSGTGNPTLAVRFFSDAAGVTQVGSDVVVGTANSTAWGRFFKKDVMAPATARTCRLLFQQNVASSTRHARFAEPVIRRTSNGELIVNGSITGDHLITNSAVITGSAQIASAIINDGHINNLSAAKLTAGTALAATITVSGRALSAINSDAALGAQNPATRINAGSTQIDPGKIIISGGTSLADWRGTSNTTSINGGVIETDSIKANSIALIDTSTLVPDANYMDPLSWKSHVGGTFTFGTDGNSNVQTLGARRITLWRNAAHTTNAQWSGVESSTFAIEHSVPHVLRVKIYNAAAMTVRADLSLRNVSGVEVSVPATTVTRASSGWYDYELTFTPPATAVQGIVRILLRGDDVRNYVVLGRMHLNRQASSILIADGAITGAKLVSTEAVITATAQIQDAVISEAKITGTLNANKITAGTTLAATITVSGAALSTISSNAALGAQNPATRINAATTNIDPGRITISGSTSLANWRGTTDTTRINGGSLEANSIRSNSLMVGSLENLVANGDFYDDTSIPTLWAQVLATYDTTPANLYYGNRSIKFTKSATSETAQIYAQPAYYFSVVPSEVLAFEVVVKAEVAAASGMFCRIYWFDANKAPLASSVYSSIAEGTSVPVTWKTISGQITVPANAVYARAVIINNNSATSPLVCWIGRIRVNRVKGTVDIQDGAVTAEKLTVTSLSAVSATIGILRTATSGARMEIHTDKILVYDASNVLRVRIGNLA